MQFLHERPLNLSPMAICDLSTRNPNVLFELGVRQAFDKPVVLIQEKGTPAIFDIAPLRYTEYRKERIYHEVLEDQENIAAAITATKKSTSKGDGLNSIVNLLSLTSPAVLKDFRQDESSPMMQMLMAEMGALRQEFRHALMSRERERDVVGPRELDIRKLEMDTRKLKSILAEAEDLISSKEADKQELRRGKLLCAEGMALLEDLVRFPLFRRMPRKIIDRPEEVHYRFQSLKQKASERLRTAKDDES